MACEAICEKPKKSEDATIFDVIFGHPLLPNVNKEMSKQVRIIRLLSCKIIVTLKNHWIILRNEKCFYSFYLMKGHCERKQV